MKNLVTKLRRDLNLIKWICIIGASSQSKGKSTKIEKKFHWWSELQTDCFNYIIPSFQTSRQIFTVLNNKYHTKLFNLCTQIFNYKDCIFHNLHRHTKPFRFFYLEIISTLKKYKKYQLDQLPVNRTMKCTGWKINIIFFK